MAKVYISKFLFTKIEKTFSKIEANKILDLIEQLKDNPKKGKFLGNVGKTVIKEIKYLKYRFYFVTDGYKVRFLSVDELNDLVIKFVNMSDKKNQQRIIDEIKKVLRSLGEEGFG